MNARDLIGELYGIGVRLELVGDRVQATGATKALTAEHVARVRALGMALVELLRGERARPASVAPENPGTSHRAEGSVDDGELVDLPAAPPDPRHELVPVLDRAAWRPLNALGTAHEHIATGWLSASFTLPRWCLLEPARARYELRPLEGRGYVDASPSHAPEAPARVAMVVHVDRPGRWRAGSFLPRPPRRCAACGSTSDGAEAMPPGWSDHAPGNASTMTFACSSRCRVALGFERAGGDR